MPKNSNSNKGIWLYELPYHPNDSDTTILLLDADGFEDNSPIYTSSIFILSCLISSTIIYYDTYTANTDTNTHTNTFLPLLKYIDLIKVKKDKGVTKEHLPQLVYIAGQGKDKDKVIEDNSTTTTIHNLFKEYKVYSLFNNIKLYSSSSALTQYKDDLLLNLQHKQIGFINLNGDILYQMLHHITNTLPKGNHIIKLNEIAKNAFNPNLKRKAEKVSGDLKEKLKQKLSKLANDSPINKLIIQQTEAFKLLMNDTLPSFFKGNGIRMSLSHKQMSLFINTILLKVQKKFLKGLNELEASLPKVNASNTNPNTNVNIESDFNTKFSVETNHINDLVNQIKDRDNTISMRNESIFQLSNRNVQLENTAVSIANKKEAMDKALIEFQAVMAEHNKSKKDDKDYMTFNETLLKLLLDNEDKTRKLAEDITLFKTEVKKATEILKHDLSIAKTNETNMKIDEEMLLRLFKDIIERKHQAYLKNVEMLNSDKLKEGITRLVRHCNLIEGLK